MSVQALRTHVAGIDVHKEVLVITVLIGGGDEEPKVTQFDCRTFTEDLMKCGQRLRELGVTEVALESTGVYWKPVYNVLDPMGIHVTVGNASHIKNVPGRKTDINDSHWIAQLHRFGLIRASFIPGSEWQRMRLISRHRTNLVDDLSRVKNRVQKVLEDGNIKIGSVVSDVFGVAGLEVLRLIADGVLHPDTLAAAVKTNIKRKEEVRKSLTHCLTRDHCYVIAELLKQHDELKEKIQDAEHELHQKMQPYAHLIDKLKEIPGIDDTTAMAILTETTNDMSHFKDERSFAAWAGVAPGNHESAGKKKDPNAGKATPI
jgi:transposase